MTARKATVKIGGFDVGGLWLAPMAGYTDVAFRELCLECGAGLTVTEMVSVRGLVYGNAATKTLMQKSRAEAPSCIQLFGSCEGDFARVVGALDFDIIDVNMGCPMPKIVKNGDGAALLKTPERAGEIVRAIKSATDKPVTVKTRLGYSVGDGGAARLIECVAKAGAAAVTVHGRYAEQRYAGEADLDAVRALAKNSPIPIAVNGDIDAGEADALLRSGEFLAVVIGRAALANPAIFRGERCDPLWAARRHVELLRERFDDRYTVNQARKFFVHYFKGVPGGKAVREAVNSATTADDVVAALDRLSAMRE